MYIYTCTQTHTYMWYIHITQSFKYNCIIYAICKHVSNLISYVSNQQTISCVTAMKVT